MAPTTDPCPANPRAPLVWLEDLWDYAYCPLKLWWRRRRPSSGPDSEGPDTLSGEDLFRESLRQSVSLFYRSRDLGKPISFPEAVDFVWNGWMQQWGLADFRGALADFRTRYRRLLDAFSATGGIRRPGGTLYTRPTWTHKWQEMAQAGGLYEIRKTIEQAHPQIGLPSLEAYSEEDPVRPIGLAEAYALSAESADRNQRLNEFPAAAIGVHTVLVMDLLSVRLQMKADLVLAAGITRGRGRPRQDRTDETEGLMYELHIYDDTLAPPQSYSQDIRILAALESRPCDWPTDRPFRVRAVMIRHMRSGQVQPFTPRKGSALNLLETLMRGLVTAEAKGVCIPRCLHGWTACADCALRPRCFDGEGVLSKLLPGSVDQLRGDQEAAQSLHKLLPLAAADRGALIPRCLSLLQWMEQEGLSPARASWALENAREEKSR
jgi:hypothetical protein